METHWGEENRPTCLGDVLTGPVPLCAAVPVKPLGADPDYFSLGNVFVLDVALLKGLGN